MRSGLLLACAALVAVVAVGCGGGEPAAPSVAGDVDSGAVLYDRNCAGCHGADGTGAADGPGLLYEQYALPGFDDQALVSAIVQGAPEEAWEYGAMPRIRGLSDQDLADLVAFVRALQGEAGLG
jgi:mono/diheme cytochrome c family protein